MKHPHDPLGQGAGKDPSAGDAIESASASPAPAICPECGAALGEYARCEQLFHRALLMEGEAPQAGSAHHLLVATYMLQHPSGFTPEGRDSFLELISNVLDERLTAEEQRERIRGRLDQQKRKWNFKAKRPEPPELHDWPMTIADVIQGTAAELPERVWRWAAIAREESREG